MKYKLDFTHIIFLLVFLAGALVYYTWQTLSLIGCFTLLVIVQIVIELLYEKWKGGKRD